ncbi:MAG: hypothetical protein ACRDYY_02395 [Acidimicrobiales bacterium]
MARADAELLAEARSLKSELLTRLFGAEAMAAVEKERAGVATAMPLGNNIVGLGFGAKMTSGSGTEDLALRVYVRTKLPLSDLPRAIVVPAQVNSIPTDIVAVGDIRAFGRPTTSGVSVGHYRITAGTAGCITEGAVASSDPLILSNNHVLANSNDAQIGDPILEPGPMDGGDPNSPIGHLSDLESIRFAGPANEYDAAIASLANPADMTPDIPKIGRVNNPPVLANLYQSVRKYGRTTRHTVGVVVDLSADINVRYGAQLAAFDNQLAIVGVGGAFSDGGDSGSLIVDAVTRHPVALLFAGGGGTTFGSPIDAVLTRFGIRIL